MKGKILVILMVIFILMACKTDSGTDPVCECPNGTLHLIGENCCERNDCTCEKNVDGVRSSNGIAITDRAGIGDISTVIGNINTAISTLAGIGYSGDTLAKNVKEVTIVTGSTCTFDSLTKIITIGVSTNVAGIRSTFADYLEEPWIVP